MKAFPLLTEGQTFVIAEIGVNHNGDIGLAKKLIDVAVDAGADAVKFQTFKAEKLASPSAKKATYQSTNDPRAESQLDMLKRLELTEDEFREAAKYTRARGLEFLSTPFDEDSADFLASLDVSAFKVGSGDLISLTFLRHIASHGKPMIISTGMATLAETAEAVAVIEDAGEPPLAILHCVSQYPAEAKDANLRAMDTMAAAFNVPIGWSDHTMGAAVTLAAVARGARIVEKHYTLDCSMEGPDHKASLEPDELKAYIADIRKVDVALGDGVKTPVAAELNTIAAARKSLVLAKSVQAGEQLFADDVISQRPGTGIVPKFRPQVIGRTVKADLPIGHVLSWSDFI